MQHYKAPKLTQELELYKSLQHMHVVTYIDHHFDKHCSTLYIFLEYVPGGSIASMLERWVVGAFIYTSSHAFVVKRCCTRSTLYVFLPEHVPGGSITSVLERSVWML